MKTHWQVVGDAREEYCNDRGDLFGEWAIS